MDKLLSLFIVISTLAIAGCSSAPSHTLEGDYQVNQNKGLLVMSLTYDNQCKPKPNWLNVFITSPDQDWTRNKFAMVSRVRDMDFNSPDVYLYVREMDASLYKIPYFEILNVSDALLIQPNTYRWDSGIASFRIGAGRATYVGQYMITDDCENGNYMQKVSNEWERDKSLLISKMPDIDLNNVVVDIMAIK